MDPIEQRTMLDTSADLFRSIEQSLDKINAQWTEFAQHAPSLAHYQGIFSAYTRGLVDSQLHLLLTDEDRQRMRSTGVAYCSDLAVISQNMAKIAQALELVTQAQRRILSCEIVPSSQGLPVAGVLASVTEIVAMAESLALEPKCQRKKRHSRTLGFSSSQARKCNPVTQIYSRENL